jgi:hypothetical protein
MEGVGPGRADYVLGFLVIEKDRIGLMGENIDGRRYKEDKIFLPDPGRLKGKIPKFEMDLKLGSFSPLPPAFPAYQVEEKKFFGRNEILLENPVSGKGVGRIRDQSFLLGKANRL